jgi:hypothetical protein
MAYPTVSAAYGFKPVNLIGGQVFAGSTRNYPIAYNYGTAIYYGDFVTLSSGTIVQATKPVAAGGSATTVGVFLGCYYTNPTTKQRQYAQYYPGSVLAGDITAIVGDDPDTVFQTAVTAAAGSTTIASASLLVLGANMAGNTLTGSASTGNGAGAVVAATATTSNAGFRVLGLVPDSQTSSSATTAGSSSSTSLAITGATPGLVIPIGTDVFNVINGQLSYSGTATTAASTIAADGTATLSVVSATVTAGTLALVQTPEVLVKLNFGVHRYYVA